MSIHVPLEPGISIAILRSLGHFAWEACLLAGGAAGALRLLRAGAASCRYAILVLVLLAMPVCLGVTWFVVNKPSVAARVSEPAPAIAAGSSDPEPGISANGVESVKVLPSADSVAPRRSAETSRDVHVVLPAAIPVALRPKPPSISPAVETAYPERWGVRMAPGIVGIYFCGVLLMLVRLCLGIFSSASLRANARPVTEDALREAFSRQLRISGIRFAPALLYCEQVIAPAVVGILKPAVLLPVCICAELSIGHVELLLAHELAHIRRHDQIVDLLQRMIEAFFFFHPAVWYVSGAIRLEREKCCDDMVVRQGQSRLTYAAALVRVAELSSGAALLGLRPTALAQSAAGKPSHLRLRILRLIGLGGPGEIYPSRGALLAALGTILVVAFLGARLIGVSHAQTPAPAPGAATTVAATQSSTYEIVYDNGVTVELIAVSSAPSRGQPFWDPSGLHQIDAPYDSRDGGVRSPDDKQSVYEVTARITGVREQPMFIRSRAADGISVGYGAASYHAGVVQHDFRVFDCYVPRGTDLLDFDLGIAANDWHLRRAFKELGVYGEGPDRITAYAPEPHELKSRPQVQFRVKLAPSEKALRLVAVDEAGTTHLSKGDWWMGREDHAIGDPRAVPGLIEALGSCPFSPNDYGGGRTKDLSLLHFMIGLQTAPGLRMPDGPTFDLGRPVNEIANTLEWITGHGEGYPASEKDDRHVYEDAAQHWRTWWEQNKSPFLEGLASLRITGDPGRAPLDPVLPDPQRLAADIKKNPNLAKQPVLDRWTLLHLAVLDNQTAVARVLIDGGADVNAGGAEGWRPLHLAAALGRAEIVQLLLDGHADVNAKTGDGSTPLLAAVGTCAAPVYSPLPQPSVAVVKLLIGKGAEVKDVDSRQRTALHGAAAGREGAVVKLLLDRGAPVNAKDDRGRTPLHRAAECESEEVADALLAAGADVNAKDATGRTPIQLSSYSRYYPAFNPPMIRKLLDHGAEVKFSAWIALGSVEQVAAAIKRNPAAVKQPPEPGEDRSVLQWAISRKSPEMIKLLLDAGADPNAADKSRNTPLHDAVQAGDKQVVALLIAAKADVNAKGQGECLPLYWACTQLNVDVVDQLLAAGATPADANSDAPDPLHAALQALGDARLSHGTAQDRIERSKTIINALLARGVDVNRKINGFTAIYGADGTSGIGMIDRTDADTGGAMAELLLEHGAKLDVTDDQGDTPLHYAAILSRLELLHFLLKHHAAMEVRNKKGETPLHCAVGYFAPEGDLLKSLLDAGADMSARDAEGKTPLHRAVKQGSPTSVTALLEKGADANAKDNEGATPVHIAAELGRDELIEILLKHGGAINAPDSGGRTPLQWTTKEKTRDLLVAHGAVSGPTR